MSTAHGKIANPEHWWIEGQVPIDVPAPLRGETPWLPGFVRPVMDGPYRRLSVSGSAHLFSWFDSATGMWLWSASSPDRAAAMREPSLAQRLPWCGLLQPPDGGYGTKRLVRQSAAAALADITAARAATARSNEGDPC